MIASANFQFLGVHDPSLATLGGLAERYFRDDPPTALIKLRQLAEGLAKLVAAAHHATVPAGERETFEETLTAAILRPHLVPLTGESRCFTASEPWGMPPLMRPRVAYAEALTGPEGRPPARAVWFHRTYGKEPGFKPGAFRSSRPSRTDATPWSLRD